MSTIQDKKIVIAGGNGFLGHSLANYWTQLGADVTVLCRKSPDSTLRWSHALWDGRTLGDWSDCLEQADALVNLAGRTVNCIKTPDHQDEILRSRVESTRVLGQALSMMTAAPPVWVQMSTAHIYGDPPHVWCTETSAEGIGLAPTVARAWEAAFHENLLPEQRGVLLRTSFVIGRDRGAGGGALETLGWLARWGLGGRVGKGTQGMSWIHELDLNRLFTQAILDPTMTGAYISSAPSPVSQLEFMQTLRRVIRMPLALPAPAWLVRMAAPLILRTDPELALYGRYVIPQRLIEHGFEFKFPALEPALHHLYAADS